MERKSLDCRLEIKAIYEEAMTFEGYGAVFGNMDSQGDMILKGAYAETLAEAKTSGQWPALLAQHGGFEAASNMPLGTWLDMREDDHGLFVAGKFADTPRGQEAYTLLKMKPRPAITGLSIGYTPIEWENRAKPEDPRRKLKKIKLWEVSLVTFPANDKARVLAVKSRSVAEMEEELAAIFRRNIKLLKGV
jgi:HK97 family phage prohead protease